MYYSTTAPLTEPAVEAAVTPVTDILDAAVIKPPNVKITSEGIGGKIFSTAIRIIIAA